jgi:branched-chain amino acid transport system permease protein
MEKFSVINSRKLAPYIILIAVGLLVPAFLPTYYVTVLSSALSLALIALGVNLILSHGEMLSFGHAAYYGLAAYMSAILLSWFNIPLWIAFPTAIIIAVLFGLAAGVLVTRRRGIYFAIFTLIIAEVLYRIVWYTRTVGNYWLGGSDGFSLPPWYGLREGYYLIFAFLIASCLLYIKIINSPFGRTLKAIGENELRARFIGYNVERYKIIAFALSTIFPAVGGAFLVGYFGYISPDYLSVHYSALAVVAVFLGGVGSILGAIIGSIIITFLLDVVSHYWLGYLMVVGLAVIIVILFIPRGIIPTIMEKRVKFAKIPTEMVTRREREKVRK